jgi:putative (di)nucleoside polyphosphate hydrolase
MGEYRKNVAAIILNHKNQIWLGERFDRMAWGFPQGGIEENESPKAALYREMMEELGTNNFEILAENPNWLRYDFPAELTFETWTYKGQEQKYFLVRLADEAVIDFETHPEEIEFLQGKWVDFVDFDYAEVGFKATIYREALEGFEGYLK